MKSKKSEIAIVMLKGQGLESRVRLVLLMGERTLSSRTEPA